MTTPETLPARTADLSEIMLDGPLKNLAQAWAIAKVLAQSSMVPGALRGSPQNCFSGETRYWTRDGIKTLRQTAGTVQEVLVNAGVGAAGSWRKAEIRSFGDQPLYTVTLRRMNQTKIIRATAGHRWLVGNRRYERRADRELTTIQLEPGHRLAWLLPRSRIAETTPSPFGIAHGVTFGDGARTRWSAGVCLYGQKDAELLRYFTASRQRPITTDGGVTGVEVSDLPLFFKDRPPLSESVPYLYGWLAGYFAADGCVDRHGLAVLTSADRDTLEFAQLVATHLGIGTHGIRGQLRQGYGEPSMIYQMQFVSTTLRSGFFLIASHRERYETAIAQRRFAENLAWHVVSVQSTGEIEEVFCAVVPEHENFVLDDWINVKNCLVTMMLGQELGLTWTQATRGIYVLPNGTPGLRGQLLLALIRKAGHRVTFERGDDWCTCTITRKDEDFKIPYEGTFNLGDALLAGLVTKKDGKLFARSNSGNPLPWEQYQRDMLQWRAVARAAGIGTPEVIYGFDIAGIGDGNAEGAGVGAASGPVPPGGSGPGQVFTAEVVDDTKGKLAGLDEAMKGSQPNGDTDYAVQEGSHGIPQAEAKNEPGPPPQMPGYDDLDQLLKRSGFHGDAQDDLVSALVHRHINGMADLTKGEVLLVHDVVTKAVKGTSTVGARREALTQIAAAERDAMDAATEEAGEWHGE